MKKIFLPLILILFTLDGFAQFKGNPGKAKSSLDKAALKTDLNEISKVVIKEDFYAFINAGNNVLRSLEESGRSVSEAKKYLASLYFLIS